MALDDPTRDKLLRILALLGSDHDGERAAAALAANRLLQSQGLTWAELIGGKAPPPRVVVQRVKDWNVDHLEAAEARLRQLKATTERQERQIRALRSRINSLTEAERKRRAALDLETDSSSDGASAVP